MAKRKSEGVNQRWMVEYRENNGKWMPDWVCFDMPSDIVRECEAVFSTRTGAELYAAHRKKLTGGEVPHRVIPVTVTPIAAKKKRLSSGTLKNKDGTPFKLPKTWGKMRKVKKNAK